MTLGFGAWGLLPVVVPLLVFVAARLGRLAAGKGASLGDQAATGVLVGLALVIGSVRALAVVDAVLPSVLIVGLGVVTVATVLVTRGGSRPPLELRWDSLAGPVTIVAALAIGVDVVAARWLPVWQWDALGYHLPFVHFVLQGHGMREVPLELDYVGSYPHNVELFVVALRACLPDDRLVDLAQVPFGVAGAIATACLAHRGGADRSASLAAGAAWCVVPVVFLQMPTDYVDVAAASLLLLSIYFVLAPPTRRSVLLAGLALGLFLGSKPSAPIPAAVLFVVLVVRSASAGQAVAVGLAGCLVCLFGAETYVRNTVLFHNPIWPVTLDLGPLHLRGIHSVADLLASGANAPHLTGPVWRRVLVSMLSLAPPPAFDMRIGGMGVLFLLALPFALSELIKMRSVAAWIAAASTVVGPDPAISRYVLAVAGFTFALSAPRLAQLGTGARSAVGGAMAALSVFQIVTAVPGLTGEGPPLWAYASMSEATRALAVGADGRPVAMDAARRRVGQGESFAFDENLDLCDLAWDLAQSYRVVFLPKTLLGGDPLLAALLRDHVRVVAAAETGPVGALAESHPERVHRLEAVENCKTGRCALYLLTL